MDPRTNNLYKVHFVPHLNSGDIDHKITMQIFTAVKTSHLILQDYYGSYFAWRKILAVASVGKQRLQGNLDIRTMKLVSSGKQGAKKLQSYRSDGQALTAAGRWCSQNFYTISTRRRKVATPTDRLPLRPMSYQWYSILLESESTPEPQCGRRNLTHRDSNPRSSGL